MRTFVIAYSGGSVVPIRYTILEGDHSHLDKLFIGSNEENYPSHHVEQVENLLEGNLLRYICENDNAITEKRIICGVL